MSEEKKEECEIASPAARFLSAFVDYFIIIAFLLLASKVTTFDDYSFLSTFFIGLFYYSLGNSRFLFGQTLGKRMLGLRVISINKPYRYLTLKESAYRYFFTFGLVILATELPILIYRHLALMTSPIVLDLHMVFVLSYSFANAALLLTHAWHRAGHDHLVGSMVIRMKSCELENVDLVEQNKLKHIASPKHTVSAAVIIAGFLWGLGVSHPVEVANIQSKRFLVENQLPFRLSSVEQSGQTIKISGIYTEKITIEGDDKTKAPEEVLKTASEAISLFEINNPALEVVFDVTAIKNSLEPVNFKISFNKDKQPSALSNPDQQ